MRIEIDYSDLEKLEGVVSELADRFSDLTPFWNDFAEALLTSALIDVFETEGGGAWAPLDPSYAAEKALTHPGASVLVREGHYFAAATSVGHPGNIFEASPTELIYGIDGSYFESTFGENYPERHELGIGVSQRAVFGVLATDAELEARLSELLDNWSTVEIAEVSKNGSR